MSRRALGSLIAGAGIAAATGVAAYTFVVGPWQRRWGATPDEVRRSMPGDELVPDARYQSTRAITIDAPPEAVWPWLAQMGQGRGGLYSYDFLENLMGLEFHSADRILPELQNVKVGDTIALEPGGSGYRVHALEPGRLLLLYIDGSSGGLLAEEFGKIGAASTWAFLLEPLEGGRTRLLVRWRARYPFTRSSSARTWLIGLFLDPVEFLMEQKMMRGIKARAERTAHRQ